MTKNLGLEMVLSIGFLDPKVLNLPNKKPNLNRKRSI